MKKKVVLVGLGYHGVNYHIPALKKTSKAMLAGVVSSDPKDVKLYSKVFRVPGFTNIVVCLEKLNPDIVILAVYHNQYLPLVKVVAKRKINILCEKPFGLDLNDAKAITRIVNKHKIHMQIGVQRRFSPDFITFAQYVNSMYDKYFFEVNYEVGFRSPHGGWRGKRKIAGGGSIIDFGYHVIDVILWNFGLPNGVVTEMSWKAKPEKIYDTEDTATFLLRYERQKFYGNVILSRVLPKREYYKVIGSREYVEYENGKVRMYTIDGTKIKGKSFKTTQLDATISELDYFCDVIDNKAKPISTSTEHLEHMSFIKAAYLSEKEGKYINPHKYI